MGNPMNRSLSRATGQMMRDWRPTLLSGLVVLRLKSLAAQSCCALWKEARMGKKNDDVSCLARRGQSLLRDDQWRSIGRSLHLSGREFQIVQRLFDDEKELAIAQQLGVSPHTIHTYLGRLYRKIGVSSRCELLVRVFAEYISLQSGGD